MSALVVELREWGHPLAMQAADEIERLNSAFSEERSRLIACIPTNWLDPLLTGPDAVIGEPPWNCPEVEKLLRAIRARMESPK